MENSFNKLVRDKIPLKIKQNGEYSITKTLNDREFEKAIDDKLKEEALEVALASNKDEVTEELADLLEVMLKKAEINNITFDEIEKLRKSKRDKRGGFDKKVFLVKTYDKKYVDKNRGCFTCNNDECPFPLDERADLEDDGKPAGYYCMDYVFNSKKHGK